MDHKKVSPWVAKDSLKIRKKHTIWAVKINEMEFGEHNSNKIDGKMLCKSHVRNV